MTTQGNSERSEGRRKQKKNTELSKTFILTKHCFKIESEKIKTRCFMCFFFLLVSFSLVHNFSLVSPIVLFQIGLWWILSPNVIYNFLLFFHSAFHTATFHCSSTHTHYCFNGFNLQPQKVLKKLLQSIC